MTTDRLTTALADRYTIERELGQGGMATVYLAHDIKHDRKVAIKVLKPELAAVLGAERFIQEIKTTAALSHPHILPLFDSGSAEGQLYYVMPYIEGETVREKLNRETQFGIDESVRITTEVADALDYAHRHGVIHRDIKPENILLHDGRPMVMDFGIALAVSAAAGGRMTETGLSLGTPHYMSPEQATADREITGRSDIYSLGTVLYEMLTGNPPHTGASAQQIIMKIVTEDAAPVTRIRKSVPPNVAAALAKALEKLPADRFATAKAFGDALTDPHFRTGTTHRDVPTAQHASRGPLTAALTVAVLALAAALWGWLRTRPSDPEIRYALALPGDAALSEGESAPTPAPDGSYLVYVGSGGTSGRRLWIKRRDDERPAPIAGTDGARDFALSPDGKWIAFTGPVPGTVNRMSINGGAAVPIVTQGAAYAAGLAWLDQNTVVFPTARADGISAVHANGGAVAQIWKGDSVRRAFELSALPLGRGFVFNVCHAGCVTSDADVFDARTGKTHEVLTATPGPVSYIPSGHLGYVASDGGFFAVAFDLKRLTAGGSPIPIADSVSVATSPDNMPFHVSASGTLVLVKAAASHTGYYEMNWVDQTGRMTPLDTAWKFRMTGLEGDEGWALSPDEKRLAIGLSTSAGDGIWVKELPNGAAHRITYDTTPSYRPRWGPSGQYITFLGTNSARGFAARRADGTGTDSTLLVGSFDEGVITPDGKRYLLRGGAFGPIAGGRDIASFRPGIDTLPQPLIATRYDEEAIMPAPDGHWVAYQSDETGRTEVYIRPFPDVNTGKQLVSRDGGRAPLWSRDGTKLYYVRGDGTMMVVRMTTGSQLHLSNPTALFHIPDDMLGGGGATDYTAFYTPWDITRDGRFLMARLFTNRAAANATAVVVVENWLSHWRRGR
jgi:serine/threonine-protein kinase